MWPFSKNKDKENTTVRRKTKRSWLINTLEKIKNEKQLLYYQSVRLINGGLIVIFLGVAYYPTLEFALVATDKISAQELAEIRKQKAQSSDKGQVAEKATSYALMDQSFRIIITGLVVMAFGALLLLAEVAKRMREVIKPPPTTVFKVDLGGQLDNYAKKRDIEEIKASIEVLTEAVKKS